VTAKADLLIVGAPVDTADPARPGQALVPHYPSQTTPARSTSS
jgi:hypothetical protein